MLDASISFRDKIPTFLCNFFVIINIERQNQSRDYETFNVKVGHSYIFCINLFLSPSALEGSFDYFIKFLIRHFSEVLIHHRMSECNSISILCHELFFFF